MQNTVMSLNGDDWKLTGWWENQWRFQQSMELSAMPDAPVPTVPATVPGAVQADLIRSGLLLDPNIGLNSMLGEWVNNREWFYDKLFTMPAEITGDKLTLVCEGLDYSGEIYLNGSKLTEFSGMFIPVEIDVTGAVKLDELNHLRIVFFRVPEVYGQFGYSNQIRTLKSRFNYIWDWCPRIVPVGIWGDIYIKQHHQVRILDFYPDTAVTDDGQKGCIHSTIELDAATSGQYIVRYKISSPDAELTTIEETVNLVAANQKIETEILLEQIKLWWPSGQGDQYLYEINAAILDSAGKICDQDTKKVGFRHITFVDNDQSPPGALPYTLQINGQRIFIKGVNWVPVSPFYGSVTRDQYRHSLERFRRMNCNLLRVWGGGILEKRDFYELCDEMGLLVWQEFPQSSSGINNTPPDDKVFLQQLEAVAVNFVYQKRHHACHVIWCGGNELMWENYKPVDDRHSNIKMLHDVVSRLDSGKCFLPSSASGPAFVASEENFGKGVHHDVHGPWNYLGNPDHYRFFNSDDSMLRSETGSPGIARLDSLKRYQGDSQLWPPDKTNIHWLHRGAWWIQIDQLSELFGTWKNDGSELAKYVSSSRFLQAESLRYAVESTRRREPVSSGFILWMGNEPFPNNANTSVIEYDGTPKPAYCWIRQAFSSVHASLKYEKTGYSAGEQFAAEIYLVADQVRGHGKYEVKAQILDARGRLYKEDEWMLDVKILSAKVGKLVWMTVNCEDRIFFVRLSLSCHNKICSENTYLFTQETEHPFKPLRDLPACGVVLEKSRHHADLPDVWQISNQSGIAAIGIYVYGREPDRFIDITPNYLVLLPGETKELQISAANDHVLSRDDLCLEVYNS